MDPALGGGGRKGVGGGGGGWEVQLSEQSGWKGDLAATSPVCACVCVRGRDCLANVNLSTLPLT